MNKILILQSIYKKLYFIIIFICLISCTIYDKEAHDIFFYSEYSNEVSDIDFKTIDRLNESNQKAISILNISFEISKDVKTLQLLLGIKKEYQKTDNELSKLTKKSLILLPKFAYDFIIYKDSIKSIKSNLYLFKELKKEINNQIILFDDIEKNTQNIDFKIFAIKSKKILKENNEILNTLIIN